MRRTEHIERESASLEQRCWVRLTRCCNNRCAFCHDSEVQDGTVRSFSEVASEIRQGRKNGARRLILSGGEPTLHPRFVDFVQLGRDVGFSWIQVVTNGRRFSYPGFATRVRAAGLDEATFSMHGHNSALHDELVRVDGGFEQSLRGMKNLMEEGCVVNVDVVLNSRNIRHLVDILSFFVGFGVREFDLLWLVPFGRAWENRNLLFFEPAFGLQWIRRAIRYARRKRLTVWTNRLPPWLLEGAEELIQDPHKIHDEVNGRRAELKAWLNHGQRLRCRQPARCRQCFLEPFCGWLENIRNSHRRASWTHLVCDPASTTDALPRWVRNVRLLARDQDAAARFCLAYGARGRRVDRLVLLLDTPPSRALLGAARAAGREIVLATSKIACVRKIIGIRATNLEIILNSGNMKGARLAAPAGTCFSFESCATASETARLAFNPLYALPVRASGPIYLDNIPLCVQPKKSFGRVFNMIGAQCLTGDKTFDLDQLTDWFIREGYRVRSLRCRTCCLYGECPGFPINLVRHFGFSVCRPLEMPI